MGIIKNLFGSKSPKQNEPTPQVPPTSDPASDPNLIRVYDKFGQELFVTKEQWRANVLPGTIQSKWSDPEELYGIIYSSLNDGFFADVVGAAEQLYRIDPIPTRAACIYGIVLMKNKRLDEAEKVLRSHMQKHGEEGVIMTNLAKVYADRSETQKSEDMLWRALQLDPNQDNGLGWYEVIYRERGGEAAGLEALQRVAALPGSWRAQLWLARAELKSRNMAKAMTYYHESLSRIGVPIPADVLMQISGDLGNLGYLAELLQLAEPLFDIEKHGLQVGNNLIKAHLELGHIEAARAIVNRLYALKRLDWKQTLGYWDIEIAKAHVAKSNAEIKTPPQVTLLGGEGPVWLKPASPAAKLFAEGKQDGPTISFLGSSVEKPSESEKIQQQLSDVPGRLSRALPLFLAEQVQFSSGAHVRTLIPWIEEGGGFMLAGFAWDDEQPLSFCRKDEVKSDYIVVTHLKVQSEPWIFDLRVIRVSDGKRIGSFELSFAPADPGTAVCELAKRLLTLLANETGLVLRKLPALYRVPDAGHLGNYLVRLEQLLAVRCGTMEGTHPSYLSGEREIIEGNLHLCLAFPKSVVTRLVLVQTLLAMNEIRPEVVNEFADKIALLQKEEPLTGPAQALVQSMLSEVVQ